VTEGKQERWMERAVKEIDDKNEGSKRPEFRAGIHRYSGEYHVRAAETKDQFQAALKSFDQALGQLRLEEDGGETKPGPDRDAMLIELGVSLVVAGGDGCRRTAQRFAPTSCRPTIWNCATAPCACWRASLARRTKASSL
jgi:hypothetical protein